MYNTNNILKGEISLNGDKSISHRILMIASLIKEESVIYNLSNSEDVKTTINCLRDCGVLIESQLTGLDSSIYKIKGGKLRQPDNILNCQNSGSTARMLIGLLAGQGVRASFNGDSSLIKRPMKRIIDPLVKMGVEITSDNYCLPININPHSIKPINYSIYTKSAQVKSSLMFAALGITQYSYISYSKQTRNHTEKILQYLDCDLKINDRICIRKTRFLKGIKIQIPGDISNAAFLIAASIIIPGSKIKLNNILFNSTRMAFIDILKKMGAKIKITNIDNKYCESTCSIESQFTHNLRAMKIDQSDIIQLIDEIPILCIVATQAKGTTIIEDGEELRFKETDRISAIYENLKNMGADIREFKSGLAIKGQKKLYSANIKPFGDHRIAMSLEVLNFLVSNKYSGKFRNVIDISFPGFYEMIDYLKK